MFEVVDTREGRFVSREGKPFAIVRGPFAYKRYETREQAMRRRRDLNKRLAEAVAQKQISA